MTQGILSIFCVFPDTTMVNCRVLCFFLLMNHALLSYSLWLTNYFIVNVCCLD